MGSNTEYSYSYTDIPAIGFSEKVRCPGYTEKRDGTLMITVLSKSNELESIDILIPLYRPTLDLSSIAPTKRHTATRKGRAWIYLGGEIKLEICVEEVQTDAELRYSFHAGCGSFIKRDRDSGDLDIQCGDGSVSKGSDDREFRHLDPIKVDVKSFKVGLNSASNSAYRNMDPLAFFGYPSRYDLQRDRSLGIHFDMIYKGIDPTGLSLDGEIVFDPHAPLIAKPLISFWGSRYSVVANIVK